MKEKAVMSSFDTCENPSGHSGSPFRSNYTAYLYEKLNFRTVK